uniref:Uncharacterized protein n=1 Tax=Anguilla anguilla TaxID=7936 RepID=A0A0E9QLD6_ANGAN
MYSENVHVFLKCEKLKGSIQSQLNKSMRYCSGERETKRGLEGELVEVL